MPSTFDVTVGLKTQDSWSDLVYTKERFRDLRKAEHLAKNLSDLDGVRYAIVTETFSRELCLYKNGEPVSKDTDFNRDG